MNHRALGAWILFGSFFVGLAPQVEAATVVDTFQFTGSVKEWCRGNPVFSEAFPVPVTDGLTVTITRDPLSTGDLTKIWAHLNNSGSAEIDAFRLKGLAFPKDNTGLNSAIILSGTTPSNSNHFLTMRGGATFDTGGNLIKVNVTVFDRITGTYTIDPQGNQSGPVDCFDSSTFETQLKLPNP